MDLLWEHVHEHEYAVELEGDKTFSVKLAATKYMPKGTAPIEYVLQDAITARLFSWWHQYHAPASAIANQHHKYVFPFVCPDGSFDFSKQFSYQNFNVAATLCCEVLGLQLSPEAKQGLGCKSIRYGNAAQLGQEVKGAMCQ